MLMATPKKIGRVVSLDATDFIAINLDAAPTDAVTVKVDVTDADHAAYYTRTP
jgi:hypothetical protein